MVCLRSHKNTHYQIRCFANNLLIHIQVFIIPNHGIRASFKINYCHTTSSKIYKYTIPGAVLWLRRAVMMHRVPTLTDKSLSRRSTGNGGGAGQENHQAMAVTHETIARRRVNACTASKTLYRHFPVAAEEDPSISSFLGCRLPRGQRVNRAVIPWQMGAILWRGRINPTWPPSLPAHFRCPWLPARLPTSSSTNNDKIMIRPPRQNSRLGSIQKMNTIHVNSVGESVFTTWKSGNVAHNFTCWFISII